MRKGIVMICALILVFQIAGIRVAAEDSDKNKDNENKSGDIKDDGKGNLTTSLPFPEEIKGEIYATLYGRDDDINIDIPGTGDDTKDENKKPDKEQPKPGNSTNKGNDKTGKDSDKDTGEGTIHIPNISDSNQDVYGIRADGTGKDGIRYYKWEENQRNLYIYKPLFELAKTKEMNIVMRFMDEKEDMMLYRVRIKYEDMKDKKSDTIQLDFGKDCQHNETIESIVHGVGVQKLLSCRQKNLEFPVYIGVGVPNTWNHDFGVYQYQLVGKTLELIRKDLKIDEENAVEVELHPGHDYVFYQSILPKESVGLMTWIKGLTGNSQIVNQWIAIPALVLFVLGIIMMIGIIYITKEKRKHEKVKTI